jgi:hypothetical protein
MQESGVRWQQPNVQFAIAIFDDWEALQAVLDGIRADASDPDSAVLHARRGDPPLALRSCLLKESVDLPMARSCGGLCCTRGDFAEELAARIAGGARNLADALRGWLTTDQASQLQTHIDKGRLALWVRLQPFEDSGALCGRLVQASPHMVGLCSINFKERHN